MQGARDERRRSFSEIREREEEEEGGGVSMQLKLHRLLFDTVTTSVRFEK